jgi:hypothetical protein
MPWLGWKVPPEDGSKRGRFHELEKQVATLSITINRGFAGQRQRAPQALWAAHSGKPQVLPGDIYFI